MECSVPKYIFIYTYIQDCFAHLFNSHPAWQAVPLASHDGRSPRSPCRVVGRDLRTWWKGSCLGLDGESGGVTIIACSNSNVVQLCLDSSMIVHICSYSIAKTSWRVLFDGVGMKKPQSQITLTLASKRMIVFGCSCRCKPCIQPTHVGWLGEQKYTDIPLGWGPSLGWKPSLYWVELGGHRYWSPWLLMHETRS